MFVMTLFMPAENDNSFEKNLEFVYKDYNISDTLVPESFVLLYNENLYVIYQ